MIRKLVLMFVLVILPGGLIALALALAGRRLSRTERGRVILARARAQAIRFPRVGTWLATAFPLAGSHTAPEAATPRGA